MITEHWDKVEDWDYSNVGKKRTEGVEKSVTRIIRAARFCCRRMRSKSVFEQFPQVTEHVKTLHFNF